MGLDMYAYKKKLTSDNWEVKKVGEKNKRTYEETEMLYLRKSNQIHNWIIENKAGGEQDQREVELTIDDFKELKGVCEKVLKKSKLTQGLINNCWGSRTFDPSDTVDVSFKITAVDKLGKYVLFEGGYCAGVEAELVLKFIRKRHSTHLRTIRTCRAYQQR